MKKLLFVFTLIFAFSLQAQHSISGTFSPAKDFTWVIAYGMQPGMQGYIADTAINDGKFSLQIPAGAPTGTYRLVYAVPQEEFYFDVLYNGQEDIRLSFDLKKGVTYETSQENKIYESYFKDITLAKQRFIDFYDQNKTDESEFLKLAKELEQTQIAFEESTKGMLVHHFIKANKPYIPSEYEPTKAYWQHKKVEFFKHLDVMNPVLQASGFLTDRFVNYVFTSITTDINSKEVTEKILEENVNTLYDHIKGIEKNFQVHIFQKLWYQATASGYNATADFIYEKYLKDLAIATNNQKIIDDIEVDNRLRIGAKAPEITWQEGNQTKKLSEMEAADCYVVIFWSSTCSHCLKELPELHQKMKDFPNVKVLAVGLEEDDTTWKTESAKLGRFQHAIALGKWDSPYTKLYNVQRTPTYYILDKDKRILANPESDKAVVEFLNN